VVLGCANEEAAAPAVNPGGPAGSPGLQPHQRPELNTPPPKEQPKASETPKADESKKDEPKKDEPPKVEGPKAEGPKASAGAVKLTADELAAIKELPAAEQDQALKQVVCPVSNHNLGSMGKPSKVTAEGRTFYLCCDDCQEELKKNPKAVIARLDKK
jgi:YHS domain-containing protein